MLLKTEYNHSDHIVNDSLRQLGTQRLHSKEALSANCIFLVVKDKNVLRKNKHSVDIFRPHW